VSRRLYLGIDPGKSGAIAVIDHEGRGAMSIKLSETPRDVWEWLVVHGDADYGAIERVGSRPGQGVSSTFKFGESFGFCQGVLVASGVRHEFVSPSKWQGALGCRSKGDKNVTKARAQQLFPDVKVTHANADALLLAEYARRIREGAGA